MVKGTEEGNVVDLEDAVHQHYRKVYLFALHLTRDEADAADLTQYAYEQLARKRRQVREPAKVRSWLQSTLYRKHIDQKRRIIRFPEVEFDEEQAPHTNQFPAPGKNLDARAAVEALDELEEELRAPLSLFYLNACSYKEIAETLDLPIGTVMSRLHRGKEKLFLKLTGIPS
jgi:RNA polymerase sigma-70 factor (ECF subfamily)